MRNEVVFLVFPITTCRGNFPGIKEDKKALSLSLSLFCDPARRSDQFLMRLPPSVGGACSVGEFGKWKLASVRREWIIPERKEEAKFPPPAGAAFLGGRRKCFSVYNFREKLSRLIIPQLGRTRFPTITNNHILIFWIFFSGRRRHLRVPRAQQVVRRHEELQVRLRHQPGLKKLRWENKCSEEEEK